MENELNTYDLFLRFSRNELSSDEVNAFENQLSTDSDFANAFEEYKLTDEILVTNELMEVDKILNSFDYTPTTTKTPKSNKWLFLGLGAIFTTVISLVIFTNKTTKEKQQTVEIIPERTTNNTAPIQEKENKTTIISPKKESIENIKQPITHPNKHFVHGINQQEKDEETLITNHLVDSIPNAIVDTMANVSPKKVIEKVIPIVEITIEKKEKIESKIPLKKEEIVEKNTIEEKVKAEIPTLYYIIPSQNISWNIPFDNGKVMVMNKSGKIIKEIILEEDVENSWDGNTYDGFISNGLYLFYIQNNKGELLLNGKLIVKP